MWNGDAGVSLGKFIFVPKSAGKDPSEFLLNHEYGHTIQSLILGPLYLPLIGAPSFAWNRLAFFERRRIVTPFCSGGVSEGNKAGRKRILLYSRAVR